MRGPHIRATNGETHKRLEDSWTDSPQSADRHVAVTLTVVQFSVNRVSGECALTRHIQRAKKTKRNGEYRCLILLCRFWMLCGQRIRGNGSSTNQWRKCLNPWRTCSNVTRSTLRRESWSGWWSRSE